MKNRPKFINHHSDLLDPIAHAYYNGSDETFTIGSALGSKQGLKNLGIHHEILKPGKRSSWPHAHSVEEEFVVILEGSPTLWINGELIPAKPRDVIYFPPGSNLAHTVMNQTEKDVVMIVVGEQDRENGDLIYYPEHPSRNEECKTQKCFWEDRPLPPPFTTHKSIDSFEQKDAGSVDEPLHYYMKTRDLGRSLGAERVALHHLILMPHSRTGIPHCESLEEEFIYVLNGELDAWLDGYRYKMTKGDSCALPSGTGILHTFINDSDNEVELLLVGETWKDDNQCIYGINPELQEPDKPLHWHDWPKQEQGPESSIPKKRL